MYVPFSQCDGQFLTHTQAYIKRTAEVNSTVHAVVELNPDALAIAQQLDDERQKGASRG